MAELLLCMGRINQIAIFFMSMPVIMTLADARPLVFSGDRNPGPKSTHVSVSEGCARRFATDIRTK
jgi:hypothetical protein